MKPVDGYIKDILLLSNLYLILNEKLCITNPTQQLTEIKQRDLKGASDVSGLLVGPK